MAKNYLAKGDNFDYPAAGTIVSGAPVVMGDMVGVFLNSGVSGDIVPVAVTGVFTVAKDGNAIALGAKVYWDPAGPSATATAGSLKLMGYAYNAALAGDATVNVRLIG